jgi:RHS repeat-associated protein
MTRVVQNLLLILMLCLECFGAPGSAISVPAARSKSPAALYFRPVRIGVVFGEQYDPDLGLYYLRARYYSPHIGVFWSMDSWEGNLHNPVTQNKYSYGNCNPIQFADPSGRFGVAGSTGAVSIAMNMSSMQLDAGFAALDASRRLFGSSKWLDTLFNIKGTYDAVATGVGIAGIVSMAGSVNIFIHWCRNLLTEKAPG